MQAITQQPMSSVGKKIHDNEPVASQMDAICSGKESSTNGSLSEETKESFHSSTTSSSTLTLLEGEAFDASHASLIAVPLVASAIKNQEKSMNAGEIRKNLDKVDRETLQDITPSSREAKQSTDELLSTKEEESSNTEASVPSASILEMSSQSESSTETVTASIDSQHMAW